MIAEYYVTYLFYVSVDLIAFCVLKFTVDFIKSKVF